ncbi:MAG TPA: EscU/YscU/HrcU family type III secretion system export apparatus switch protein [Pseudomonadales bacterium]|nr:EscU/YscU/HrcU family type III secretion system export apparatus switch protein [Pseudomonadales bacterium]
MTDKELKRAAALHYDKQHAPTISASGEGMTAEDIIALAEQYGVPLYEHPELAEYLCKMPVGTEIPRQLYYVIAEIIAFAYIVTGKTPD